jgi:hypothetical protein
MYKKNIFIIITIIFLINIGFTQQAFLQNRPDTLLNHNNKNDNTIIWVSGVAGGLGGFLIGDKIAFNKSGDTAYYPINDETVKWTIIGVWSGVMIGWLIKKVLIVNDDKERKHFFNLHVNYNKRYNKILLNMRFNL